MIALLCQGRSGGVDQATLRDQRQAARHANHAYLANHANHAQAADEQNRPYEPAEAMEVDKAEGGIRR